MTHLYRPVLLLGCQFGLREPGQLFIRLGDGEQGVLVGTIAQLIRAATRVLSALSPMRWVVRPRCWRSDQAQDPAHNEACNFVDLGNLGRLHPVLGLPPDYSRCELSQVNRVVSPSRHRFAAVAACRQSLG